MLKVGGKTNSLGRAAEVVKIVLRDQSRLKELYDCVFVDDAWVRMRAIDSIEKVCRVHPDWLEPYVDRFSKDLATSTQPSIQWHLAEIYGEVQLTPQQKQFAIKWLKKKLASSDADWIVAANSMKTFAQFAQDGSVSRRELIEALQMQQHHASKAVVKRATKLLEELAAEK